MNFSSHIDAVVTVAVRLVNALTPGEARGRPYAPPGGARLAEAAAAALAAGYDAPPDAGDLPAAVTAALRQAAGHQDGWVRTRRPSSAIRRRAARGL